MQTGNRSFTKHDEWTIDCDKAAGNDVLQAMLVYKFIKTTSLHWPEKRFLINSGKHSQRWSHVSTVIDGDESPNAPNKKLVKTTL